MWEEAKLDEGVSDWESGLPSLADLTPLSQSLIPAILASAFKISPEPTRTAVDVNRASQSTISSLRGETGSEGSDPKKNRRVDPTANDLAAISDNFAEDGQSMSAKALKKPRLVWTPQLHTRFVEVVALLGLENAVPKTIMQLMNVEGLTREKVASHLQKYRVYVKRMQGSVNENEGPLPSDYLFASMPLPSQSVNKPSNVSPSHGNAGIVNGSHTSVCNENNPPGIANPMPPQIMMMGLGYDLAHLHNHPYQLQHQKDWSGNNMYHSYPRPVAQNNNNKC